LPIALFDCIIFALPPIAMSESPVQKPPPVDDHSRPPAGRKFPCPGCGAKLDFDPSQRALKCPYCGYAEQIDPNAAEVRERNWNEYWAGANSRGAVLAGRSSEVQCRVCAAVVLLEDKIVTDRCPYCASDLENRPRSAQNMILPEGILPFKIDQKRAVQAFNEWIASRWFAPGDLKRLADRGRLAGVYVPFWTYDSMTYTRYSGERGDDYQETETYVDHETYTETDSQGRTTTHTRPVTKTRTVTKTRWWPVSGHVDHFFDDVLVCASKSIPGDLMNQLAPWDLHALEPFRDEFLAGFQTERYTIDLKSGFEQARRIMDGHIRALCCRDIGGDHQRLHSVNTQHTAITFKHLLQPVWLAPYRYRDKTYRFLVNARTGEVVGTRPYSFAKIFWLIAIIVAIIAVIGLIAAAARGDVGRSTSRTTAVVVASADDRAHAELLHVPKQHNSTPFTSLNRVESAAFGRHP
jgi:ribosomal protein S27E